MQPKPSECAVCVLAERGRGYVEGNGPLTARLLIIGEAPGEQELEALHPFVGPSGYHLNRALLGERDLVRVDNTRRCLPPEKESTHEYLESTTHCSNSYLRQWLPQLQECRTILTVGADALKEVVGVGPDSFHHKRGGGLARLVGSVWSVAEVTAIRAACRPTALPLRFPPKLHSVVAAIHPAAALRGSRHLMPTVYQMIQRARRLSLQEEF